MGLPNFNRAARRSAFASSALQLRDLQFTAIVLAAHLLVPVIYFADEVLAPGVANPANPEDLPPTVNGADRPHGMSGPSGALSGKASRVLAAG